ncbi:MAG: 3'-5' exonuclease [Bacteroidota bacterium]
MNRSPAHNITKEDIQQLPLLTFEGEIRVINTHQECNEVLLILEKESLLGFDTETKPTFHKGEYNPTSLIQLSTQKEAFLFRLNKIGYPKRLFNLLANPNLTKLGISILDDLKDLNRLSPFTPQGFIDLNHTAKELGIRHIGVRKLTAIFLEHRISKNQRVSNWENEELTEGQKRYAATDAWICIEIHDRLLQKGYI